MSNRSIYLSMNSGAITRSVWFLYSIGSARSSTYDGPKVYERVVRKATGDDHPAFAWLREGGHLS